MVQRPIFPGADDANGLAFHVEARQALDHEVAGTISLIGLVQAPIEHQHQGHGVFGDGVGGVRRHANHVHPMLLAGLEIDVIEAGERSAINSTP